MLPINLDYYGYLEIIILKTVIFWVLFTLNDGIIASNSLKLYIASFNKSTAFIAHDLNRFIFF